MKFEHLLAGALLSLAAVSGCRDTAVPATAARRDPETVVARWKGGEIRRGAIQEALDRRLAAVPKPVSPEAWKAIVRQVIERRVRAAMLFDEAKAQGFTERPEVRKRQAAAEERVLAEDLLARETASVRAAEPQVAAEVQRRLAAIHPDEARKFSHIFLRAPESDPAARARAAARMETIRQELGRGANFNQLAEKYSTSVTARGGGRIEWTLKHSLNRAAAEVIFALAEGEVSQVVSSADGLHLFRLDGIRPGTPADAEAVRRAVRQELDTEARSAAMRARRRQELDARGVEPAPPGRRGGQESEAALRQEVENRLLAEARRAQGLTPEIAARVAEARREAVIEAWRETLVTGLDTQPTEEEIARYHRDHADALLLRDFRIDLLFFPQTGDSVADVYAAGEAVGAALREGAPFDDLLRRPARPDARLCREAHGVDLTALGRTSIRLRKALLRLGPGEISPAIYLDGPRTEVVPGTCVLEGRGVAFVRLRGLGTLPLAAVHEAIRATLAHEKEVAGIEALRNRLLAASGLEILVPEG